MRLLVLGGTSFVGRHIVAAALASEQQVTIFNRGETNPALFPAVERRVGDRNTGDLASLESGEWDAVIDVSGVAPETVRDTADLLAGRVGLYAFISTVSTYRDLDVDRIDEDAPLTVLEDPTAVLDAATYGGFKAACESEVRRAHPDSHLIVRAGTMAGPFDDTDRFTYWVRRMARGTAVLGPSRPEQPVQVMDARDHASFVVQMAASGTGGTYNVVGSDEPTTFADMIQACVDAAGISSRIVWPPQSFLDRRGLRFPLDILTVEHKDGIYRVAADRALAAGFTPRPLADTAADVLRWDRRRADKRLRVARGVAPAREAKLLALLEGTPDGAADDGGADGGVGAGGGGGDGSAGSARAVRRTPVSPLGLDIGSPPRRVASTGGPAPASVVAIRPVMSCLIATTPRTGSWLLADLLAAIGLVGQPQEFFRQDFVKTFSRKLGLETTEITAAYLEGIFASASPGTGVFSAKLQPFDFTRLRSALGELSPDLDGAALIGHWLPEPRYVHLTRRERGRQAISWYRALMSNVWWAFRDTSADEEHPRYPDLLQVRWLEDQIAKDEVAWAEYFRDNKIVAHEVVYEDIVDDPDGSVRRVLDFLEIDVPGHLTIPPSRLEQMANTDTELWLQAYDVVRDGLPPKPDKWFWSLEWGAFIPPSGE